MIGTHTLLPVCGCLLIDRIRRSAGRARWFTGKNLCCVGVCGFLPDILSPHLSLESRYASLSHTVWFFLILPLLILPLLKLIPEKRSRLPMWIACWCAAALHLAADAISGGIAWLHPWRSDILGKYWIAPQTWIWYDIGFIVGVWVIYRVLPHFRKKQERVKA